MQQCEADLFMGELFAPPRPRRAGASASESIEQASNGPSSMIVRSRLERPGFYRIPRVSGHYFARPVTRVWGQLPLILFLVRLSARWAVAAPGRPFGLGDLAEENGGPMTDHVSHQTGLGADIYVLNSRGVQRGWNSGPTNVTHIGHRDYDRDLTLKLALLIKEVVESGFPMVQVLFNDTTVQQAVGPAAGSSSNLIKTDRERCGPPFPRAGCTSQHDDHIHVLLRGTHPHSAEHVQSLLRLSWSRD